MLRNPVARGDLRARSRSPRALTAQGALLGAAAFLAFLALPPVLGRLDAGPGDAVTVYLLVIALGISYLTSAASAGEIEVEGEKDPEDLLTAPFRGSTVAAGKALSALLTSAYLVALTLPLVALVAAVRGMPPAALPAPLVVVTTLGASLGALGALYAALFENRAARVLVHWATLAAVFVGLPLWRQGGVVSPLGALRDAASGGTAWLATTVLYVVAGAAATAALARRFDVMKRDA